MYPRTWPGLFKRCMTLSTRWITNQHMAWFVLLTVIHWIAIYPVDSIIQPLNNWGQGTSAAKCLLEILINHQLTLDRHLSWESTNFWLLDTSQSTLHQPLNDCWSSNHRESVEMSIECWSSAEWVSVRTSIEYQLRCWSQVNRGYRLRLNCGCLLVCMTLTW